MKNKIIPFLLLINLAFACHEKEKSELNYVEARLIYENAIVIHDEIMPKMGNIMQLQRSLKLVKEQIIDPELIHEIDSCIQDLGNAHNEMMNWMRNITRIPEPDDISNLDKPGLELLPSAEEMEAIQSKSLNEIEKVKENINSSIKKAKFLLDSPNS